jgi:hypothetical protein
MRFKQVFTAVLVSSFVLPATLPSVSFAQSGRGLASSSSDPIDLILQALAAKTPAEARALLAKAQEKAAEEKLPPASLAAINELLAEASTSLKLSSNNPLAGAAPATLAMNGKPSLPAPAPGPQKVIDTDAIVAKLMEDNPDLHSTIVEIGIGRLKRDSSNLEEIVKVNTGQSIAAADTATSIMTTALSGADDFIKALRAMHVIHDWSATNKALRDNHPSVPVDVLAKQIIERTAEKSVLAGAIKKLINSSGVSTTKEIAGVSVEALGVYAINADLVIRLADLYQMNMTESQQDIAILAILPVAKLFTLTAKNSLVVKETAEKLGELFSEAKANPNPTAMARFYAAVFASPLMASLAKRLGLGAKVSAAKSALGKDAPVAQPVVPVKPETPVISPAAPEGIAGLEAAVVKMEAGAAAVETKVTPILEDAASVAEKAARVPLGWKAQAAWLAASMVQSGAETYAVGRVSMWWFAREKQKARQIETADFHRYLMGKKSRGFFKLLIATMNKGSTRPPVIDLRKATDSHGAKFIMNIARSVAICSPAESARFKVLQSQTAGSRIAQIQQQLSDPDYRLLRFQCDSTLGFGRYTQIAKEFMTLNAIPEWEVAELRMASYTDRVQMGELLMQLQFLDGEPNDDQNKFFNTTISTILGLTRLEDSDYFDRFYGFIRERKGMRDDASSPTGFSIRPNQNDDPYALSVNYTASGGPEAPSTPPVAATTPPGVVAPGPAGPGVVRPPVIGPAVVGPAIVGPAIPAAPAPAAAASMPPAIVAPPPGIPK